MVRLKRIFGICCLMLAALVTLCVGQASAQESIPLQTFGPFRVSAQVGEFYLSVAGYISPYSSVVLISDGVFYRAAVADAYGNFSISQVLIRKGFSHFCLQAVDFRRLGSSETCFEVPPANGDVVMKDIFLPPTIGLQRNEISAGSDAVVFGYTMPGASVVIHLNNGESFTVTADTNGYYEYHIKSVKAGYYTLFADATYKGKPSTKSTQTIYLKALSVSQQLSRLAGNLWKWLTPLLSNPLWWGIPLLILITYLTFRIWPEKFTAIYESRVISFLLRKRRKLHHWWMEGVGY
jgi:hypothetical protein